MSFDLSSTALVPDLVPGVDEGSYEKKAKSRKKEFRKVISKNEAKQRNRGELSREPVDSHESVVRRTNKKIYHGVDNTCSLHCNIRVGFTISIAWHGAISS